jgi:hypothetical protein
MINITASALANTDLSPGVEREVSVVVCEVRVYERSSRGVEEGMRLPACGGD